MLYGIRKWPHVQFTSIRNIVKVSPSCLFHQVRGKQTKFRHPVDPKDAEELPEFEYAGRNQKSDTLLYVWGVAAHGALGRGTFVRPGKKYSRVMDYCQHPHRLGFGEFYELVDLCCGYGYTVVAVNNKTGPTCFGTGLNTDSQIGTHEPLRDHPLEMLIEPAPIEVPIKRQHKVTKVSAGRAHSILATTDGVWSIGNNAYGQCGRHIIEQENYSYKAIYHRISELDGLDIKQVECGQDTSIFLTKDGVVHTCGWGADGQTGRGTYDNVSKVGPVVGDITGENIVKVSCRADCALAVNDAGEVFGWGNSEYHQLNSITSEMQIHSARRLKLPSHIGRVVDVAAAGTMCLILNENGDVFSWGYGPIGRGPDVSYCKEPTLIPRTLFGCNQLSPSVKVSSVHCGLNMLGAVNSLGSLYTWGKNPGGCLGHGHTKDHYFPIRVCIAGNIKKVSMAVDHMAVLVKEII